jgi:hypothetical protein
VAPLIVKPPPAGISSRSMPSRWARCSGRSAGWPKSPKWATRIPSSSKTTIVFGPRSVPATPSCSEAIATTLPTGVSCVPASERTRVGSPSIFSTPLWSACSWVTISRSTAGEEIAG